jgi:excisionase family DNA binding protein
MTIPTATERPTLSVREAAPLLGVSAATLFRAIAADESPVAFVKCGARISIVTADLRSVLHVGSNGERNSEPTGPG